MTKKRTTPAIEDNTPDFLVKPKSQFETQLKERIGIGEELLERPINNQNEYRKLNSDYSY